MDGGLTTSAGEIMEMRKRILAPTAPGPTAGAGDWLDVEQVAEVELTSEDPAHPIEHALRPGDGTGWRAAEAGTQVIRLRFDAPQRLRRIRLVFQEDVVERTQEFSIRWSSDGGRSYREAIRQQYNFSPPGTTREIEEYEVEMDGVSTLELTISPDLGGGRHSASLSELRLASSVNPS
jgi:hypothetical protein